MSVDIPSRLVNMAAEYDRADDPLPWAIHDLVVRGGVTILAGRAGVGKTWLALDACRAVATGAPFLGLPVDHGSPVVFDWESGRRRLGRRLRSMGAAPDEVAVDFAIMDGLHLRPRPGDEVADALEAFVRDRGYSFVVLDSLRRLAGNARENESDEMAPIVARLGELARRLHVGVLVLHHASRAGNLRGSTAIEDQADAVFLATRGDGDGPVRIQCTKLRDAPEPTPFGVELVTSSEGVLEVRRVGAPPTSSGGRPPVADVVRAQIIDAIRAAGGRVDSRSALAGLVGRKRDDHTLRTALGAAVAAGEVVEEDRNALRLPPGYPGGLPFRPARPDSPIAPALPAHSLNGVARS